MFASLKENRWAWLVVIAACLPTGACGGCDKDSHPIFPAAQRGDIAEVQRFLDEDPTLIDALWYRQRGGDLVRGNSGLLLVHVAASGGHTDMLKLLKERGANLSAENEVHEGQAIHYAASAGHAKTVEWLLDNGVSVDPPNRIYGHTPLHEAASMAHVDVVDVLLAGGADANKRASTMDYSMTPLHSLCRSGFSWRPGNKAHLVAKKLLEKGADVNARDDKRMTALDHASGDGENKDLTKVLIDHGAEAPARK